MKVAIFTDAYLPDINGVATSCAALYHELIAHGHKALIVTTSLPKNTSYVDQDNVIRIRGLTLKKLYGYRMSFFYNHPAMNLIREFNPDIIHTQTEFGIGLFGRVMGEILHKPVIYTYHTMYEDYTHYLTDGIEPLDYMLKWLIGKVERLYGNHCTHVIVPSKKAKDALRESGIYKNISIIPTGLDLHRFAYDHVDQDQIKRIRDHYDLNNHFTILFLGRVAQEKSIDFLIHALKKIIPVKRNVRMMIVGGGPELSQLKRLVKAEHLEHYVIFTGSKNPEDVPAYYRSCDVFACASLSETQGLTYLEAMASGLPVFARYDHNLDNVIQDGKNGFFFHSENEYVRKLINMTPELGKKVGHQAATDAQKYSSEDFYQRVMEVYMEASEQFEHYQVIACKTNRHTSEIVLSNPKQKFSFKIDNETIKKYDLKVGRIIDQDLFGLLRDRDGVRKCYNEALKALSYHDYTEAGLKEKLTTKDLYSEDQIDMTLSILSDRHLIDDFDYAHNYTSHCLKRGYGLNKARRDLVRKGVSETIIDEAFTDFSDEEVYETAFKMAEKYLSENKRKPSRALKDSIKGKLMRRGFDQDCINQVLENLDIHVSKEETMAMLEKEYERFYRRYQKKFHGQQLYLKIKNALIQKGYSYEFVNELMEDVWSEEND